MMMMIIVNRFGASGSYREIRCSIHNGKGSRDVFFMLLAIVDVAVVAKLM